MKRNHEENDCVRVLSNKCHLNVDDKLKTIRASRNQAPGNKAWGRIDYLMKVHGYIFMWDKNVQLRAQNPDEKKQFNKTKKVIKKMKKDDNLGKTSKKR